MHHPPAFIEHAYNMLIRQLSYVLTNPVKHIMHLSRLSELGKGFNDKGVSFRHRGLLLHSLNDYLQVCKV